MSLSQRFETLRKRLTVGPAYGVMILLFLAVFFWGVFKIITPENFGSTSALVNYFLSSIIYSVGGCGLFFIVVMGMFDFSIGANVILSSIVGVIASTCFGYPGLLVGCIACGTLIGFLNGFLYIKLRIPSMIVTVGLMLIFESTAYFVAGGKKQTLDTALRAFGKAPASLILAIFAFLLMNFILRNTKIGTYCCAIGSNEYITKNMGINVDKYKLIGFVRREIGRASCRERV